MDGGVYASTAIDVGSTAGWAGRDKSCDIDMDKLAAKLALRS
jgi:hypothetical protein